MEENGEVNWKNINKMFPSSYILSNLRISNAKENEMKSFRSNYLPPKLRSLPLVTFACFIKII